MDLQRRRVGFVATIALLVSSWIPAVALEAVDGHFLIDKQAGLSDHRVTRVIGELNSGLAALKKLGVPLHTDKFPITVTLKAGRGISRSYHGRGPIILHRIAAKRSPIVHELTHMLAGYTWANGHWTAEGFASFMQDKYGGDIAYPTRRQPHELLRVILDEGAALPMIDVMRDRRREKNFGKNNPWHRFLAYAQSSSFCKYLIDTYGIRKFLTIYDQPYEDQEFQAIYGKSGPAMVNQWHAYVRGQDLDLRRAKRIYRRVRNFTR